MPRSAECPPLAVVLEGRQYEVALIASITAEVGLASIERPLDREAVELVRQVRPAVVFAVSSPSEDDFMQLLQALQCVGDLNVVAILPDDSSHDAEARALTAGAVACLHDSDNRELATATVKALLRREAARPDEAARPASIIAVGPMEIDRQRFEVRVFDARVGLTAQEFYVLSAMADHVNRVRTAREILEDATGRAYTQHEASDALKVYIQRIRNKIGLYGLPRSTIRTVRGVGYMLREPAPDEVVVRDPDRVYVK